jgi:hypothetical protein
MTAHPPSRRTKLARALPLFLAALSAPFAFFCPALSAQTVPVTVRVENLSQPQGYFVTPTWVAFHNGTFDTFNQGTALGAGNPFEPLVEDGVTGPISTAFRSSPAGLAGGVDRTITAPGGVSAPPVFDPGESASLTFDVNPLTGRYFTYAAMVIPSNDAFIGNDNPTSIPIFDAAGNFTGPVTFTVLGTSVRDAGTEANNETSAAFFNQVTNGDGTTTSEPVTLHPGLLGSIGNPGGTPVILGHTSERPVPTFFDASAADFTRPGAAIVRFTITPEPSALLLLPLLATAASLRRRRRVRRHSRSAGSDVNSAAKDKRRGDVARGAATHSVGRPCCSINRDDTTYSYRSFFALMTSVALSCLPGGTRSFKWSAWSFLLYWR